MAEALNINSLERLGVRRSDLNDPFLRRFQRIADPLFFDREYTAMKAGYSFEHAKVQHIGSHIGKLLNKVNHVWRPSESSYEVIRACKTMRLEAFPDTLLYRTQLANTLRVDLASQLGGFRTGSTSIEDVLTHLIEARAAIDSFTERLEHGKYLPEYYQKIKTTAIPALHFAGVTMGNIFDETPAIAHATRLQQLLRVSTHTLD